MTIAPFGGFAQGAIPAGQNDGRGDDTTVGRASVGVQNMTDRIGALGGELSIRSAPGSSTTISGSISLET